jgi:hypothetical protein
MHPLVSSSATLSSSHMANCLLQSISGNYTRSLHGIQNSLQLFLKKKNYKPTSREHADLFQEVDLLLRLRDLGLVLQLVLELG